MQGDEPEEGRSMKRRRLVSGCQNCRVRHLKCDNTLPECARCVEAHVSCVRGVNVRFKNVNNSITGPILSFQEDQTWVRPNENIRYHDETLDIASMYENGHLLEYTGEEINIDNGPYQNQGSEEIAADALIPRADTSSSIIDANSLGESPGDNPAQNQVVFSQISPTRTSLMSDLFASPEHLDSYRGHSYNTDGRLEVAKLTTREALLMRNFIEKMALWADVTDIQRHFEIEIPRRALLQPVIRLAIFAFSARHINRKSGDDETESLEYHNECLNLLIPILSGPDTAINEDVLAAIAILRQYEEMDAYDNRCHLIGTTRILNSISTFGSSGGLAEAVAWLCLRQDIYVSLVTQQPLKTHLENYHASQAFQRSDDVSWATQMVWLLAKVLTCAFVPDHAYSTASLQQMNEKVELWNMSKPATFDPIKFVGRSREEGRPFPEIWLLSVFHVIALQYYHIAKLVLAVSLRDRKSSGYETLRQGRKIEKAVRNHLLVILGLAASNKTAENTLFTARHTLSVWGWVFRDELEQQAAVSFLQDMEKRTGWRATPTIDSLREKWDEDNDVD